MLAGPVRAPRGRRRARPRSARPRDPARSRSRDRGAMGIAEDASRGPLICGARCASRAGRRCRESGAAIGRGGAGARLIGVRPSRRRRGRAAARPGRTPQPGALRRGPIRPPRGAGPAPCSKATSASCVCTRSWTAGPCPGRRPFPVSSARQQRGEPFPTSARHGDRPYVGSGMLIWANCGRTATRWSCGAAVHGAPRPAGARPHDPPGAGARRPRRQVS